ncbi:MAG: hypothetical protein GY791_07595 [Alphaproteobacteria bacterium]|nr:hypothetical protein [Alphaproteobacteria bacterium]
MTLDLSGVISDRFGMARSTDAITILARLWCLFRPGKLQATEIEFLSDLEARIQDRFEVRLPLVDMVATRLGQFNARRRLYKSLMRQRETKRLFVVVAYGHADLIAAAQELDIPTIEMQHGIIHKSHPGYSFPPGVPVPYRPDFLLLFGPAWRTQLDPSGAKQAIVYGAPHVAARIIALRTTPKSDRIVFISQPSIASQLIKIAIDAARLMPDRDIVYRLHPGDDQAEIERIAKPKGAPDVHRLTISGNDNSFETLELQASAAHQVGVYSTALYEGLDLGCTTMIAALPGSDVVRDLVDSGRALRIRTAADIKSVVEGGRRTVVDSAGDHFVTPSRPLATIVARLEAAWGLGQATEQQRHNALISKPDTDWPLLETMTVERPQKAISP